jgi:phospholipid/cholesterol/gamma-HCH transport system substrate-binding protein
MSAVGVRPIHRDDARRFVWGVGVLVALVVVGAVGLIVQTGGALPGRHYTYVKVAFDNVGTLGKGRDVKEDGITIGTVSGLVYQGGKAVATLRLDGDQHVYADATASIGNGSALGKKFVALDPGTASSGPLGAAGVSAANSTSDKDVNDILAALDPKTRTALRSTLGELAEGMTGHSDDLSAALSASPRLLADLKTVATATTQAPADLPGLLASADRLASRFQGRQAQIAELMHNADTTIGSLAVDGGQPLQDTIAEMPSALVAAKGALDSLDQPLTSARAALTDLRPGGRALGQATQPLRAFLRDARVPLDKVPSVADSAEPAVSDLTGTVADARPLLKPVDTAVDDLDEFLYAFAPYAGDAGRFFSQEGLLNGTLGSDNKHYFAASLTAVGLAAVASLPDPLYHIEAYPCPGAAFNHAIITNCSGGAR